ncbi:MAG TPA: YidC/Oxa1 family membrane protein insertase [Candidatus Acidoferrales bacterium]|nr:YidC/Oxa1 family membrane protein insertase [Candidatus Acidoferrales bacterium]
MNFFDIILINPILNVLVSIYQLLTVLHIPSALGFSIILLTIVVRLILYPFMHQSIKQQKKMQQLTPHINKLKEKHKDDAKRLQVEQMALFKEHGVNPASGCLVMIIQIPILIGLYRVLLQAVNSKTSLTDINSRLYTEGLKLHHLWDTSFFGLSLAHTPAQLIHQTGFAILLVAVLTGGLQLIQSKMMMVPAAEAPKQEKKKEPDFATTFQTQTMYLLPLMVGFFSYSLPFGLSLYWNTLTIFGIIQQYIISGWGGLVDWLPFLKKSE